MKIEAGKYYKTRDGRKVQVHVNRPGENNVSYPWYHDNGAGDISGFHALKYSGNSCIDESGSDIVSEWQDPAESPIRTVTRREIVAGVYGSIVVDEVFCDSVRYVIHQDANGTAEELREAAHILNQIAEVLEENGK